jgi:hypothetical protein
MDTAVFSVRTRSPNEYRDCDDVARCFQWPVTATVFSPPFGSSMPAELPPPFDIDLRRSSMDLDGPETDPRRSKGPIVLPRSDPAFWRSGIARSMILWHKGPRRLDLVRGWKCLPELAAELGAAFERSAAIPEVEALLELAEVGEWRSGNHFAAPSARLWCFDVICLAARCSHRVMRRVPVVRLDTR